jgi:fructose-bisphosphate aldolase class II
LQSLQKIQQKVEKRVRLVLHGTNEFPPDIMAKCIERGVTRINVNKLVLSDYNLYIRGNSDKPLTELMEHGTGLIQKSIEQWMDHIGSSGKA